MGELFIVQGSRGPNWQIGYDPEVLELLTTAEEQQIAGDTWLFMAIQATTQTVIRLDFSSPLHGRALPPPPRRSRHSNGSPYRNHPTLTFPILHPVTLPPPFLPSNKRQKHLFRDDDVHGRCRLRVVPLAIFRL
ncbi:MAG: hypothetical protein IPL28_27995 [Chloroflexi bacterium]|nr:hypothetical protein [Chloroflexota bacterium]